MSGVMELAWHGCDDDEIASYSGHASKDMIRKYAGAARQEMRARSAAAKRDASSRLHGPLCRIKMELRLSDRRP